MALENRKHQRSTQNQKPHRTVFSDFFGKIDFPTFQSRNRQNEIMLKYTYSNIIFSTIPDFL